MSCTAADFAPIRFSTFDLPERERLPRWREEFGRGIVQVDIEPMASDGPYHAEATLQALPGVRTVCCSGSAVRLTRTRDMAAESDGSIGLVVNLGPTAIVSQRGRDTALATGEAFAILNDERAVLTITRHLGIVLPWAALAARVKHLETSVMRAIPRTVEPLRLLTGYLGLVQKEATLAKPTLRQSVASHIQDLAALALGAHRDSQEASGNGVAAARLAAALADIAERFTDQGLTVESVARRQGISPRYLQRLLEMSGTPFTARVSELRLERAFALLTDGSGGRRRISEIAMEAGFSDVSHFNRLFRARFGDSPSGVRTQR